MPKKETQNFCCKECRRKYFDSQKRVRQYKTWCAQCGKEIIVSRNPTQKEPLRFCCKKCGDKYRMEHEEKRICPTCGKNFVPYRSNHIFCSRICRDIDTLRKVGNGKFKETFIQHYVKGRHIKSSLTAPHLKISALLDNLGINHVNERKINKYRLDIYIEERNLAIEIMGRYWHGDIRKYSEEKINASQYKTIEKDKVRKDTLYKDCGIIILYLWEDDINNNIDLCEALIQRFLQKPIELPSYHSSHYNFKKSLRYSKNNVTQYMEK